jgi:hypothetical protein
MRKWFARLIWIPLGFLLVVFLVANRAPVAVSLDPLSTERPALATPPLPLWVWFLVAMLIGFFTGIGAMWISARDSRLKARAGARELRALKRELAERPAATPDALPTLETR